MKHPVDKFSSLQLYVAGHDVAALRETLSSELAKVNDPRIETHPFHVAWRSLDDAIAKDIVGEEGSDEAWVVPGSAPWIKPGMFIGLHTSDSFECV